MLDSKVIRHAQILWDFMKLNQPLQKSDCLLVMGSHDVRVAMYGTRLLLNGWAPLMICSGGFGNLTRGIWNEPEAVKFARVAVDMGVPEEKILIEDRSTNTGENILFSRKILREKSIDPTSLLLLHKPYMERRALATFQKLWLEKPARISSPPMDLADYPNDEISMDETMQIMVGDFQRILVYPKRGFQVEQIIPEMVMKSFEFLVKSGYSKHLIKENA
jgi:uncharacterized SAM-binding protein YcdF (DUF218 family)